MRTLSFEEWEALPENQKLKEQLLEEETDCEECNGEGEHECECGDVHTCLACDGTGKEEYGELSVEQAMKSIYKKQLADEKEKLNKWMGQVQVTA